MKKSIGLLLAIVFSFTAYATAQVRPPDRTEPTTVADIEEREMLQSIYAKYQGGLFGYSKKEHGTIKFDDINERLIFVAEDGKERFSIPFSAISVVYPSQTKVQSGTGRAVGAIPIPGAGIGGMFMKKKKNYLVVSYDDADVDVQGSINFLVDTEDLLMNAIYTIGEKAELKRRGDAYLRSKTF